MRVVQIIGLIGLLYFVTLIQSCSSTPTKITDYELYKSLYTLNKERVQSQQSTIESLTLKLSESEAKRNDLNNSLLDLLGTNRCEDNKDNAK